MTKHTGHELPAIDPVIFSEHALDRLLDWDFSEEDVEAALAEGETIEEYTDGARLILAWVSTRPIHVVAAQRDDHLTIVVTVYEPDPSRWRASFRVRISS